MSTMTESNFSSFLIRPDKKGMRLNTKFRNRFEMPKSSRNLLLSDSAVTLSKITSNFSHCLVAAGNQEVNIGYYVSRIYHT